ncbi:hypothetical protein HMPREF2998_03040 [Corynebacterium sp. HMSC065A05]|uniref:hypothetical protein n=1 Tax=Corynebacterium sp. HMSC065A05 TaxID=1739502 RepID=UPI0008A65F4C|nr:hypothetical protein [Corynebacterium sp. HMSC065A05]OFP17181.1 hypothetical protein HMPREF2998_03040 [Corynebacterium sp. HMSC065A05]
MVTQQHEDIAAKVLSLGKQLAPDRFPIVSVETVRAWALVVARYRWPEALWLEAVVTWAAERVTERMVTPRDVVDCVRIVRNRWEVDPVRGPELRAWREREVERRDAALAAGTFGLERGRSASVEMVGEVAEIRERAEDLKALLRGNIPV